MINQNSPLACCAHMLADGLTLEYSIKAVGGIHGLLPSERVALRKDVAALTDDDVQHIVDSFVDYN